MALVLVVGLLAAGCGKKASPKPAATPPPAPQNLAQPTSPNANPPPAAPVTPPPPPVNAATAAKSDAELSTLQQLNRALMGYRMQYHRNPATVEELASAVGISLPPPPSGKKYAFNNRGLVDLVDISAK